MSIVYSILGISRQAHHQQQQRSRQKRMLEDELLAKVHAVRQRHPRMGARKIFEILGPDSIGVNAFERLLAAKGLNVPRQRSAVRTTLRSADGHLLSNLTHGLELNNIDQLWVCDISYLIDQRSIYYLSHILDVYSRRLLAVGISQTMRAEENLALLHRSLNLRKPSRQAGLIHHSDAGSQYTSKEYCLRLAKAGIRISIAETCLQNAYSERLNGTLKNEYLLPGVPRPSSLSQWQDRLESVAWLYNYERPHQELQYRTPVAFEEHVTLLPAEQRPVLRLHDFLSTDKSTSPETPPSSKETGDTSCQPIS